MFEAIMENFKYMEEGTKTGLMFAAGMALYYLFSKLFKR